MPHLQQSPFNRPISRRSVLCAGAATAALAALSACDRSRSAHNASSPANTASTPNSVSGSSAGPALESGANVRVTNDGYAEHVGPSLAVNPVHPRQLLVACQASPVTPEHVVTSVSSDAGATWRNGGVPPQPAAGPAGDDVTVAFDAEGRGYVCATRSGGQSQTNPADLYASRAVYVWRTDDGGRSFSAPVTLVEGVYCDHPWIATGQGRTADEHYVYVAWGAGTSHTAIDLTCSVDGGKTFEPPRRILPEASTASLVSAGPQIAAGPDGLVCVACDWTTQQDSGGDLIGRVVAVCSTDAGQSFAAPIHLGDEAAIIAMPGGARPNSGPAVAISPRDNALYVAFPTHTPGTTHSDIVVSASHDRGQTWSAAVIATPADSAIYFQPNVTVDATGRIAISAFALANNHLDEVLLTSQTPELRFGPPIMVTTAPFVPGNPTTTSKGKYGSWWLGDWQGIASIAGGFQLVWNDTRTGKLDLYSATVQP